MARRALGPATLAAVQAVQAVADAPMLVACSGGADSLALAAAAAIVGRRRGLPVRAVIVDHGLQPGSDAVASSVRDVLAGLGLAAEVVRVVVGDSDGLEADARAARYAALAAVAAPNEIVLLGHTLDDQAETVLLGLARGSGTRSLAGMPAVRRYLAAGTRGDGSGASDAPEPSPRVGAAALAGSDGGQIAAPSPCVGAAAAGGPSSREIRFVRPLLGLPAATTKAVCVELGLTPWDDPHNAESRFARARVRHVVLPVLEAELGPGVAAALARTARLARADADLLDELAAAARATQPGPDLDVAWLAELPEALHHRVLLSWLSAHGGRDLAASQVWTVAALVTDWHGQGPLDLPGVRVRRTAGALRCEPPASGRIME